MKGAIFFSSKYGSTGQYANWIGEATGLPVFDMKRSKQDPDPFDFLILGAPIIYHKVYHHKWIKRKWKGIQDLPILFFTVSGAPAGSKLDGWIRDSFPENILKKLQHVALLGRQNPRELTWWDRQMLIIGSKRNKDPEAAREELEGFEYMDKESIAPIVEWARKFENAVEFSG